MEGGSGGGGSSGSSGPREPKYTLAQFTTLEELGSGSFGLVRRVVNSVTGEVFAMKVLEKHKVTQRSLEEQLKREVLTQIRVKHSNVVRLHYYFEDTANIHCLLEFADRGTLFQHLKVLGDAGMKEGQAAPLFGGTAAGLAYLHSLRIVHRDLKPENILLFGPELVPKIADFGWCVELTEEEPTRLTFCGTLDYLAPEMLKQEPHDIGIDLWALGVLLYEILLARAPFASKSQKESMEMICAVRFDLPSGRLTQGAEELIRSLLVKRISDRMPLAKVLRHPWLKSGSVVGTGSRGEPGLLDETIAAPRDKAGHGAVGGGGSKLGGIPEGLDESTVVIQRPPAGGAGRGAGGGYAAAMTPAGAAAATAAAAGAGGAAAAPGSLADGRTVVVPRRAQASGGGLDDTLVVPRPAPSGGQQSSGDGQGGGSSRSGGCSGGAAGREAVLKPINEDLPDLDLDGRLLGGPPQASSGVVGGLDATDSGLWLVKDFVVRSAPRPKAKSRRSSKDAGPT